MKKLLAVFAVALIASGAMAQVDPDPNGIGIYFDTAATSFETTVAAYGPVEAFLVLTNVDDPAGVSGWECRTEIVGDVAYAGWTLAGGLDADPDPQEWAIGIGTGPAAFAQAPVIVLATYGGLMLNVGVVEFYVYPYTGSLGFDNAPGYASGAAADVLIPLQISNGFPYGSPCAIINGTGVVSNEDMSWSGVKDLFQ
jgi:hypothetical protein